MESTPNTLTHLEEIRKRGKPNTLISFTDTNEHVVLKMQSLAEKSDNDLWQPNKLEIFDGHGDC